MADLDISSSTSPSKVTENKAEPLLKESLLLSKSIEVTPSKSNPLILKMMGLVSSIIILGAINDLATIVYIIRNRKQIEYLQLSGKYMYYKKK